MPLVALWPWVALACYDAVLMAARSLLPELGYFYTESMGVFPKIANPREIRAKLGLNQEEFWTAIGVTQSGGSRYEAGREMPKPVSELLRLVHVEGVDLTSVKREDIQIIEFLKKDHPQLYEKLRETVQGRRSEIV